VRNEPGYCFDNALESAQTFDGLAYVEGYAVSAAVDYGRRGRVAPNHTLTHVLNLALRNALGEHVEQRGSLVDADKLRFDFAHPKAMTDAELAAVEAAVAAAVAAKLAVHAKEVPLAAAKAIRGLRAVFGEQYPDPVRVVSVGATVEALLAAPGDAAWEAQSVEFCGGTHLSNTAEADAFALLSEEGIATGIRRIVGVTGEAARAAIVAAAGNDAVPRVVADLSSVAAAQAVAAQYLATGAPLHLLVNNAGCLVNPRCVVVKRAMGPTWGCGIAVAPGR
jgi:alanyl-tRNA synthetase